MHFRILHMVFFILGVTLNMLLQPQLIQAQPIKFEYVTVLTDPDEFADAGIPNLHPVMVAWSLSVVPDSFQVRIHKYDYDSGIIQPVDTVIVGSPAADRWGDFFPFSNIRSERYALELLNEEGFAVSPLTSSHGTIFLNTVVAADIDICQGAVALNWENYTIRDSINPDIFRPVPFTSNRILVLPPGGAPEEVAGSVAIGDTVFSYAFAHGPGTYRLRIQSVELDGNNQVIRSSKSNARSIYFNSPVLTDIDMIGVDVTDNRQIDVRFNVTEFQNGDAAQFDINVYRAVSFEGPFDLVGPAQYDVVADSYYFVDEDADLAAGAYYYQIRASLSACDEVSIASDIVSSLFLEGSIDSYTETELMIGLSALHHPGVHDVHLYRQMPDSDEWVDAGPINLPSFTDDLSADIAEIAGEIRYKLVAVYGSESIESNWISVLISTGLEIFNAFHPHSTVSDRNRYFRPRLTGIVPSYYGLSIFNRWGQEIFAIENPEPTWEGWDGIDLNGHETPPGVYGYRFEYQVGSTPRQEHTGTVTLVR